MAARAAPPVQKKHTSYAPFHDELFDYVAGKLIKLRNVTATTCPAGRTLIEVAGKRLIPEVNPGVKANMVFVHDSVSGVKGYINPKSATFKKPVATEDVITEVMDIAADVEKAMKEAEKAKAAEAEKAKAAEAEKAKAAEAEKAKAAEAEKAKAAEAEKAKEKAKAAEAEKAKAAEAEKAKAAEAEKAKENAKAAEAEKEKKTVIENAKKKLEDSKKTKTKSETPEVSIVELAKQRKQELLKLVEERTAEIMKDAEDSIASEVEKRLEIHKTKWQEFKLAEFNAELEVARKEAAQISAIKATEATESRVTKEMTKKWEALLKQSETDMKAKHAEATEKLKKEHAEQTKHAFEELEAKHNTVLAAAVEKTQSEVQAKYEALMKLTVESAVNAARKETEATVIAKLNAEFDTKVKSVEMAAIQRMAEEEKRKQIEINEQRKKARVEAERNRIALSKKNAVAYVETDELEIPTIETLHKHMADPTHTVKTVITDKVATIDLSRGTAFSIIAFFDIGVAASNLNCVAEDSVIEIYLTNFSGQAIMTATFQDMYENFESAKSMRINRLYSMYLAYKVKDGKLIAVGSYGPYGSPHKLLF